MIENSFFEDMYEPQKQESSNGKHKRSKAKKNGETKGTRYNYLGHDKKVLSHDGKTASVILLKNINDGVFFELGSCGMLKGDALKDYEECLRAGELINNNKPVFFQTPEKDISGQYRFFEELDEEAEEESVLFFEEESYTN